MTIDWGNVVLGFACGAMMALCFIAGREGW